MCKHFDPLAWIRQARAVADGRLPFVVFRPDGAGETSVASWPCLIRLEDLTHLLHAAGYGDPPTPPAQHTPERPAA